MVRKVICFVFALAMSGVLLMGGNAVLAADTVPAAVIPRAIAPGAGLEDNPPSTAPKTGAYAPGATLDYRSKTQPFEPAFSGKKEEAEAVNAGSINSENTASVNMVLVVLLILSAIIIVILVIVILLILRRPGKKSNRYLQKGGRNGR